MKIYILLLAYLGATQGYNLISDFEKESGNYQYIRKTENIKENICLNSIFLGLRFRRVWCEMCKYR